MSAKLHRFATKTGVRDSFALGLEADRHNLASARVLGKVRATMRAFKVKCTVVRALQ